MVNAVEEITGRQLRMARAALRMSAGTLAALSGVGIATIGRIESDDPIESHSATLQRLRRTLEKAGVSFSAEDSDIDGVSVPRDWAFAGMYGDQTLLRPSTSSTHMTVEIILNALQWSDARIVFFTFPIGRRTRVRTGYWCNTSVMVETEDRYFTSDLCPLISLPGHVARSREVQQVLGRARDLGIACEVILTPFTEDLSRKKAEDSLTEILRRNHAPLTGMDILFEAVASLAPSAYR